MLFFNSILIGLLIAAPVGPIGMLCIQRNLTYGFRSGFVTGLGAASADGIYGLLGALGIAGIIQSLPMVSITLKVLGGLFLIYLAWCITRTTPSEVDISQEKPHTNIISDFLTTFTLTISNPMTILSFIGIFAALNPFSEPHSSLRWMTISSMVCGVFIGSILWWLSLSAVTSFLRKAIPKSWIDKLSYISAIVIGIFGCIQMISGIYNIFA